MTRRAWIIVGMVCTAPFLICTFLLAFWSCCSLMFVLVFHEELWVENRTTEPLMVLPIKFGDSGPVAFECYPGRWSVLLMGCLDEVVIQPGERKNLVIDKWRSADVGGSLNLLVTTQTGDVRSWCERQEGRANSFVLDVTTLRPIPSKRLAAIEFRMKGDNTTVRFWVMVIAGVAAPMALLWLQRAYRRLTQTLSP